MASSLFCLSDLNKAIIESSFIDAEKLRDQMNPRGKRPVTNHDNAKPLYTRAFIDLFLPDAFVKQQVWYFAYIEHNGDTALAKLMNGIPDGLSPHRKIMEILGSRGFTVSASDDLQLLSAISDKCRLFMESYTSGNADPAETLRHWKEEIAASHTALPKTADYSPSLKRYLQELQSLCLDQAHRPEAFAGMVLLGLISGFAEDDRTMSVMTDSVFERWLDGFISWCRGGFPRYLIPAYQIEKEAARLAAYYEPVRADISRCVDSSILPPLENAGTVLHSGYAQLLKRREEVIFFTGRSGYGKKSLLQYLFAQDQEDGIIPLYIPMLPKEGLLRAVARLLRLPASLDSWEALSSFTESVKLRIYLPDLLLYNRPDRYVRMVTDALEQMPENSVQFLISSLVCPFDFTRFTHIVYDCRPLPEAVRSAYLRGRLPENEAEKIEQSPAIFALLDSPVNLTHFCSPAAIPATDAPASVNLSLMPGIASGGISQTASDILGHYVASFLHSNDGNPAYNAAFLYLMPALAAYMTWQNVQGIGHRKAAAFFHDPSLCSILHTDMIRMYRFDLAESDIAYCYQLLTGTGLLISAGNTYSFAFPLLQTYANALHSYNLFDIEVKENVFISSSYPYESHTDYFWQMFPSEVFRYYEGLIPDITFQKGRFDVARLYSAWSAAIYYGNGRDEKGCIDNTLAPDMRRQHFIDTLRRASDMLGPLMPESKLPCPAWNYAYYKKREAEELLAIDSEKYDRAAKDLLLDAFTVIRDMMQYIKENKDMPDYDFGCKHIFDKYAQFLMQRCYPVTQDEDGLWHMPGDDRAYTDQELETEIRTALTVASDFGNPNAKDRLALMLMHLPEPDYSGAYRLFTESASLGDSFARGMAAELLLDHSDALGRELLPVTSAPEGYAHRPRTVSEAVKTGLIADCVIAYIRARFDASVYSSIISDSRKNSYATAFHQLGRAYMLKGSRADALPFLTSAAAMDWSQNDNEGEYERLMADLNAVSSCPAEPV